MTNSIENSVSIAEMTKDFSKVSDLVEKTGSVIIVDNDVPRYILFEFPRQAENSTRAAGKEEVSRIAHRIMQEHSAAFRALAR
jgi:antitoxin Phd